MTQPLAGIRVLDLSHVLAGPCCAYQLGLLGAEVIKVEMPGTGDLARQLGADSALNARLMGASFLAQNAGKKSVTVNLKSEAGKEVLMRLAATAEVLVENFRPGVMERLGLGYERLQQHNRALVYCAISGFGQSGPMKHASAYDQIVQGLSGVMSITGDERCAPLRVGYPVADTLAGLTAAFAIVSALFRHRATGEGAFINVSMLDATLASMGWVISNYLIAGQQPVPMGNDNFTAAPSGTFRTGDGLLNIAANKQDHFEALAMAIGREDLLTDARFATRESRMLNRTALTLELEAALRSQSAAKWEEKLIGAGIPAGRVLTVAEALESEQVTQGHLLQRFQPVDEIGRPVVVTRAGFTLTGGDPQASSPPPRLGEHTDDVLGALGYSEADIAALRNDGAI